MARIGVLGASGFVGQALIKDCQTLGLDIVATRRVLGAGHNSARNCSWHSFDLLDERASLSCFSDCDWVICLAGTAHVQAPERVYVAEALAYQRVLGQLLDSGKRVIYLSSVKARDEADAYSRYKRAVESFLMSQPEQSWIVLRPALVYGPGMKGFLASWARAIASGWMPRLPELTNQRSLVSINNLLSAVQFAMQTPACAGRVFAVTDRSAYSSSELQAQLLRAAGREWRLPALPHIVWRALAALGNILPRAPFSSDHYQRLFGDANYQDDALAQLGFCAADDFAAFCQRQLR